MNLALELRPKTLDEVLGHDQLKPAIRKYLVTGCRHWLFIGPTGTGKTTLANIVAHEMADEIWSYNAAEVGVAYMRELVEKTLQYPMINTRGMCRRAIIIDEAHKLSKDAQSVLLSTFENEDDVVNVWILCTTEKDTVLKPLVDRCPATFRLRGMETAQRRELVERAAKHLAYTDDQTLTKFQKRVESEKLESARDLLSAFERLYHGVPVDDAVGV